MRSTQTNWSIDAEWYDANKYQPPVGKEVLCAVKSSVPVWDKATQSFKHKSFVLMYLGSRGPDGWYLDGCSEDGENEPRDDVSFWTWLPRMPIVWVNKHEEND